MANHKTNLQEGDKAPSFQGNDQDGNTISLNDFTGKKLVIYFYPKDNTPGCTAESCNLRDHYTTFQKQGYEIVGVSADDAEKHKKFISKYELPFPLIADTDLKVIKAFDVWGLKKFMGKEYEGINRTTFVINEKGILEQVITSVKTKEHAAQIL